MYMASQTNVKTVSKPALVHNGILQRKCSRCSTFSQDDERKYELEKRLSLQRQSTEGTSKAAIPPVVHEVLSLPGQPLDHETRAFMEPRFGHDFTRVRVHTDEKAQESARAVNAQAYTVGMDVVFGAGHYAPGTTGGRKLLAHELAHVLQQGAANRAGRLEPGDDGGAAEYEAKLASNSINLNDRASKASGESRFSPVPPGTLQRQFITPLGQGGGFGGLMDRDRRAVTEAAAPVPATPYQVCSRDLQGILGYIGNHAYIEAPPFRYAIISPLCPASWTDNPVTGTTAQKWDNSPDPCGKTPNCVPCNPAPGVTDVGKCLRDAFTAYNNPSLYRGLGPNSNTFAGTLARTCCAGMVPKPAILGNVPGWDDPPAPARAGASPCPPGPTC
jgi:hypothetical protein